MKTHLGVLLLTLVLALVPVPAALADHDFLENFEEGFPFDLTPTEYPRQIVLMNVGGTFTRDALTDFSDELLLPVSNGGDLELLWNNVAGIQASLALTPDDPAGNYNFLGLSIESAVAFFGDLVSANAKGGVVVRHTGPEEVGARKFYAAYAAVTPGEAGLQIRFYIQKWFGTNFVTLDSGPAESDAFPVHNGDNFRITLEITEPDADHVSTLTAHFDQLSVVGGVLVSTRLADLEGTDRALALGQIGFYVESGSLNTLIAFDENAAAVSAAVPARRTTWGAIKGLYR